MRRKQKTSARKSEQGIIITLVAIFMLGVIGAMAALSIDVVAIYTARSEAQLAADAAALAAARVIANSGATSEATANLLLAVETIPGPAQSIALQVAEQNQIAGAHLTAAQVTVTFGGANLPANPTVKVSIQKNDLPSFFARIWGKTTLAVAASATAEAYNASGLAGANSGPPVAPICVKPWLLPNINPKGTTPTIFSKTTGAITDSTLLGWTSNTTIPAQLLSSGCGQTATCSGATPTATAWKYFPGDTTQTFTPEPTAYPTCRPTLNSAYERSVGGCIQTAIACNSTAFYSTTNNPNQDRETAQDVNCLTHATNGGGGDTVTVNGTPPPTTPFEFVAGDENPLVLSSTLTSGSDIMVSDSLVTVPVFDNTSPANPAQIIGFVQLFLNPTGVATPTFGPAASRYLIPTTVINMVGCGTGATGTPPIIGNGASPVAVRLITPP